MPPPPAGPRRPLRVLFVVPYPLSSVAGQRFRFEQWLRLLPTGVVEPSIQPLLSEAEYRRVAALRTPGAVLAVLAGAARRARLLLDRGHWDAVYVYREALPFGPPLIERIIARRAPLVYDFDDAIWLGDSTLTGVLRRLKFPGKVAEIARLSAVTIVGNEYLAGWARGHARRVEVIPSTVDERAITPTVPPPRDVVRLGWSGSATTAKYLVQLAPVLQDATRRLPVVVVALGDPSLRLPLPPGAVETIPWSLDAEDPTIASFDVGIMPLPDDEWTRGKGGFKILHYYAHARPAIASSVGANLDVVRHGETGLLVSSEDDWSRAIEDLVTDRRARLDLGANGRAFLEREYPASRFAEAFGALLVDVTSSRP